MSQSKWVQFNMEERIKEVLRELVSVNEEQHHFGSPLFSPYQIAIEICIRDPHFLENSEMVIGGDGTGDAPSLARYIASELSRRIKNEEITDIEGFFLASEHLMEIEYRDPDGVEIEAKESSLFRLKN